MANQETIQELNELGSIWLTKSPVVNPYTVPEGYFEHLADQVLHRIRAASALPASEELAAISPLLAGIDNKQPLAVPEHYFDALPAAILDKVHAQQQPVQNSQEETAALSPLLAGISRKMPFSVPEGYFETLGNELLSAPANTTKKVKVISITRRSWFRYAAAAVLIGTIAVAGLLYFNNRATSQTGNPYAWVEKNMKKVSTNAISNFIQLADEESNQQPAIAAANKSADLKELMKDVSTKDIQNFLDETAADGNSDDMDDILLN